MAAAARGALSLLPVRGHARSGGAAESKINLVNCCRYVLMPALRSLLSEWTPPAAAAGPQASADGDAQQTIGARAVTAAGEQYVRCEQCEAEGNRSGAFDRWQCMLLMEDWTAAELKRREEHPSDPVVPICPLVTTCSASAAKAAMAADGKV